MVEACGLVELTVGEGMVGEDMASSIRTDRVFSLIGQKP